VAVAVRGLAEDGKERFPAVRGSAPQLHLAGNDEVELVALVTLTENRSTAGKVHLGELVRQQTECVVVERGE
jgi:hypothetical protein